MEGAFTFPMLPKGNILCLYICLFYYYDYCKARAHTHTHILLLKSYNFDSYFSYFPRCSGWEGRGTGTSTGGRRDGSDFVEVVLFSFVVYLQVWVLELEESPDDLEQIWKRKKTSPI